MILRLGQQYALARSLYRLYPLSVAYNNPRSRAKLSPELDAIIADNYGLTEEEFAYVLSNFRLVAAPFKEATLAAHRNVGEGTV